MRNLKRALSLALSAAMLVGMMIVGTGASYADVTSENNQEAIEVLQAVGIMTGDDQGNFNPDANVTRNEMAVIMCNLLDYRAASYAGTTPFTDVPSWAEPYVAACYANGITGGTSDTTYSGDESVTTVQAALMLMKALGYFQYSSDFKSGWEVATIAQANRIDLFDSVESGAREALTRSDVAQLVLNTLESGMVEADDNTIKVDTDGVTVEAGSVTYNYITSDKDYARAISALEPTSSTSATKGSIVELGEKLYNGDLKKDEGSDDFNRPANIWTYESSEIGKYADSARQSWTTKVSEKDLYQAVGSAAYDNYSWAIYQNGGLVAEDTVSAPHAARDLAISHSKTSSERVLTADKGVLTEVFVDSDKETVVLTLVDTGVAKVTKVTGEAGDYEVTVSFKTKVNNGKGAAYTPDNSFTTDQEFSKDDIVIYTASVASGEIESMAVAETVTGTASAVKNADYVTLDGTTYSYNYAYTKAASDNGIGTGIYNLEDNVAASNPTIDKEATLYLDAYGYAVAFEGKAATAEDYLFVKEVGTVFNSEPSAKVVFYDGTAATVTIDKVTVTNKDGTKVTLDATKNASASTDYDKTKNNGEIASGSTAATTYVLDDDTVYKFTEGSSSYDLEVVSAYTNATGTQVKKDVPSITVTSPSGTTITTDNNTVFVDVENTKAWTGYKNVATRTGSVAGVLNSDNVADIVFIYGNVIGGVEDDDYVILKGTGTEIVKDGSKTIYRFTDAYDVYGEQIEDLYATSTSVIPSVKGLYQITSRDADDYIDTAPTMLTAIVNDKSNTVTGGSAAHYATAAKNGVLTLNNSITFGGSAKTTFAYNDETVFVVVELKTNGDVDSIRLGDVSEITTYDAATAADTTGVYVMTVEDDDDTAPLAETVLIIVPDNGSNAGNSGSGSGSATQGSFTVPSGAGITVSSEEKVTSVTLTGTDVSNALSDSEKTEMNTLFGTQLVGADGKVKDKYAIMTIDILDGVKVATKYKITQVNAAMNAVYGSGTFSNDTKTKDYNRTDLTDGLAVILGGNTDITISITPYNADGSTLNESETVVIVIDNNATFKQPA